VVIHREVIMTQRLPGLLGRFRRELTLCTWVLCSVSVLAPHSPAQTDDGYQSRRTQAFTFYENNNFVDARPLLEKLHAEKPEDVAVLERLSFATLAYSATLANESDRKAERARARKLADGARAAGDNSNLLNIVL
jgi:hypothetical protein